MIVPVMGTLSIDAIFTETQKRVYGLIFGSPERSFFLSEIVNQLGMGRGTVQRELAKLEEAGLVNSSRVGNQKHFVANDQHPLFPELVGIIEKTVGINGSLLKALKRFEHKIDFAFVFGSFAKGSYNAKSDVDLLVVSEKLGLEDLFPILTETENRISRIINLKLYTPTEFNKRIREKNSFIVKVLNDELVAIIGEPPHVHT